MRVKLIVVSLFLASCSGFLASCSGISAPTLPSITPYKIEIRQGNLVTPDMREKIRVGMTTLQVRAALGTPLIKDPFHANRWDYQYRYEQAGKLIRQQRLTLYFEGDYLARIDEHDMPPEAAAPQATSSKPGGVAPAAAEPLTATSAGNDAAPQAADEKAATQESNEKYKKIAELYRKKANEGDAEAQFSLGQLYELGYGVPQDYTAAAEWYRKAGKQGYAKAFFNLGVMNSLGRGVNKDDKTAASLFREAAELGDAKAQYTLGMMYAKGVGVPKSNNEAMSWYRKAAAQGYAEAEAIVKAGPAPVAAQPGAATTAGTEAVPQPAAVKVEPAHAPEVESAANVPHPASAGVGQAIADAVKNWAAAWSSQDVAKYLASYAQSFKPADGMSRAAWEAQRRERVAKPKSIIVELSGITVSEQDENSARVSFKQHYRAGSYKDVTNKTLELKKIGDQWLIVGEQADKK